MTCRFLIYAEGESQSAKWRKRSQLALPSCISIIISNIWLKQDLVQAGAQMVLCQCAAVEALSASQASGRDCCASSIETTELLMSPSPAIEFTLRLDNSSLIVLYPVRQSRLAYWDTYEWEVCGCWKAKIGRPSRHNHFSRLHRSSSQKIERFWWASTVGGWIVSGVLYAKSWIMSPLVSSLEVNVDFMNVERCAGMTSRLSLMLRQLTFEIQNNDLMIVHI